MDAIHHGARGPVPLCQHQDVASAQLVDGLFQLGAVIDAFAGRLLPIDEIDAFGPESGYLPVEVLVRGGDSGVADFAGHNFRTDLFATDSGLFTRIFWEFPCGLQVVTFATG
jgi:hypothetical protein